MISFSVKVGYNYQNSLNDVIIRTKEIEISDCKDIYYSKCIMDVLEKLITTDVRFNQQINVKFSRTHPHKDNPKDCSFSISKLMNILDPGHLYDILSLQIIHYPKPNICETDIVYDYLKQIYEFNKQYFKQKNIQSKKENAMQRLNENFHQLYMIIDENQYSYDYGIEDITPAFTPAFIQQNYENLIILQNKTNDWIVDIRKKYGFIDNVRMYIQDRLKHTHLLELEKLIDKLINDISYVLKN